MRKGHAFQASIATTFVDFAFFVFKKRASKTSTFCCACGLIYNMFASISRPSSYGFAAGCPISGEPGSHRCRKGVPQKGEGISCSDGGEGCISPKGIGLPGQRRHIGRIRRPDRCRTWPLICPCQIGQSVLRTNSKQRWSIYPPEQS